MSDVRTELRRGLTALWPYLLAHHLPAQRWRCYTVSVRDRRVHVCARCLGIYPGIFAGIVMYGSGPTLLTQPVLVAALPALALGEWLLTTITSFRGTNPGRTLTGGILGYAYGLGGMLLVRGGVWWVLAVGVVYACLAAFAIIRYAPAQVCTSN